MNLLHDSSRSVAHMEAPAETTAIGRVALSRMTNHQPARVRMRKFHRRIYLLPFTAAPSDPALASHATTFSHRLESQESQPGCEMSSASPSRKRDYRAGRGALPTALLLVSL